MTDINDLGLRLFGLLSEGKQLSPTIAKTLRKSLGQKDDRDRGPFTIINESGDTVGGPYNTEVEANNAFHSLQSDSSSPLYILDYDRIVVGVHSQRSFGQKEWTVTGSEGEWYVQNENGELVGGPYDSRVVAEYEAENQIDADRVDMDNLFRGKGQKDFQIEQTGDGGVQVTLNGQVVAGPFHSEDEVRQAMAELQSRGHTPVGKGWINWSFLTGPATSQLEEEDSSAGGFSLATYLANILNTLLNSFGGGGD